MRPRRARASVLTAAAAGVLLAGAALAVAYASSGHGHPSIVTTTTRPSTRPATRTTTTTTTPPLPVAPGAYQVASTTLDAGTTGAPAGTPGARLATTVWFPTSTARSVGPIPDRPRTAHPLLVFSQGFAVAPAQYQVLLNAWASAGYVVAAPTYPHTDDSPPTFLDESDIVNHPADLRVVIGAVLAAAGRPGSPLFGRVDGSEIGLVGQSDGGDVSLAVAADTCCRYPEVKAVAILSGAELASFGGEYFGSPTPPILVVQGSADTVNLPSCSAQIYDAAPSPKWYLDLLGAPHLTPYVQVNSYEAVVAQVTTDFFDAELAGQSPGLRAMAINGNVDGVAQLSDAATAPTSPEGCPGAP